MLLCYVKGDGMSSRTQKWKDDKIHFSRSAMTVKLILRDKEYEVRPGMALVDALKKNNIVPESVIATLNGEMITDDEVLRDGDVIKLIAVISGG